MKITHVDYSILGLLNQRSLSGYQIRMVFERTALGKFSSSPGTIYPALKRLQGSKLIEKKRQLEKDLEIFAITKNGSTALKDWILCPVTRNDVMKGIEMILLRIAFIDSTKAGKKRDKFFETAVGAIHQYIVELELYYAREASNMPLGGTLVFEHGIESYKATLRWIRKVHQNYTTKQN